MGPFLRALHALAAAGLLSAVLMGYAASLGWAGVAAHIPWGFAAALVCGLAHAMTLFYFAGAGVGMREATRDLREAKPFLERAAQLRRRLAVPLGVALITVMAAAILGGGSHTRRLPSWVHHGASLAALATGLYAAHVSILFIGIQEGLRRGLEAALAPRGDPR